MTEPKRWPKRAERYRVEALALAMRVGELVEEAKAALLKGENTKAMALLGDVALKAREIQEMMRDVKRGRE